MNQRSVRAAIGAVRHGKQWRIPRPDNLDQWRTTTRRRLKKLSIKLKEDWERDFEKIAQENSRHWLESSRLWLAGYATVLERGRITLEARKAILLLRQTAGEILAPLPQHEIEVKKLKDQFPARLSECGLPVQEVAAVMRYWPVEKHFRQVQAARTLDDLEVIRRRLDYVQAVRDLEYRGKKPTAKNIAPLLHKNLMAHINDTREQFRSTVVLNPAPEVVKAMTLVSVCAHIAGKKPSPVTLDFRQPQKGLKRRTIQKRHPQKQFPQRAIVAGIYRIAANVPCAEPKPHSGVIPARKPVYDTPITARLRLKRT